VKHGEVVELEIPSSPEYVSVARQAVEGVARRMQFEVGKIEDIKLAVGEACTNAVKYGRSCDGANNVVIRCTVLDDGLLVEVKNSVDCCDHPSVPDVPDISKVGGLGLFLIRHLVDEVDLNWSDATASVKMVKKL